MTDPRFPSRPDHPDFWRLSQIILDHDARNDNGTMPMEDQLAQRIDPDSLGYMAFGRAKIGMRRYERLFRNLTNAQRDDLVTWIAGMWVDAFMAGTAYQAEVTP